MAIELIVEDGTGVANANSFVTAEEATAYAASRQIDFPTGDDLNALLINACDFLGSYEPRMQGKRTLPETQVLCYPRECTIMFGSPVGNNVIPQLLKTAQIQIAVEAEINGVTLFPNQTEGAVTEETVGPITTKYDATTWSADELPILSKVEATLRPLLSNSYTWQTIRV